MELESLDPGAMEMGSAESGSDVHELVGFLSSPQPKVQLVAVSAVAEMSATPRTLLHLYPLLPRVCNGLFAIMQQGAPPAQTLVLATKALVNISASLTGARALLALGVPLHALGRALALDREPGAREELPGVPAVEPGAEGRGTADGAPAQAREGGPQGEKEKERGAGSRSGEGARVEEARRLLQSLNVMLLANLTQTEAGAATLLNIGTGDEQHQEQQGEARPTDGAPQASPGPGAAAECEAQLGQLIRRFCARVPSRAQQSPAPSGAGAPAAPVSTSGKQPTPLLAADAASAADPLEHVGTVLVNVTRLPRGRELVFQEGILQGFLPQAVLGPSGVPSLRTHLCLAALRNCLFDAQRFLPELLLSAKLLWPALLLPLAGCKKYPSQDLETMPKELATPLGRERKPVTDSQLKCSAADAVYMLASTEGGRQALWGVNGPKILQLGYEDEEDPPSMEAFERVGLLLIEGGSEES